MTSSTVFKLSRWAAVSAAGLTSIAMLLYPGGTLRNPSTRGYSVFQNSLSDLGMAVAWGGRANTSGALVAVFGSGLLALAGVGCLIALVPVYSSSPITRWLTRAAGTGGLLSCAGLIGLALVPFDRNAVLHGRFTLLAFGALLAMTLLFALTTALNERLPRRVPIGWLVFALVLVAWIFAMPWRPTTDLELAIPVTLQKIVAVAALVILFFQSYEAERVMARVTEVEY